MTWKKGQSGNPNGRPKDGKSWASVLDKIGDELIKAQGDGMSRKEAICRILFKKASKGDMAAINAIMDRIDGKPHTKQDVDVTTGGEKLNTIQRVVIDGGDATD